MDVSPRMSPILRFMLRWCYGSRAQCECEARCCGATLPPSGVSKRPRRACTLYMLALAEARADVVNRSQQLAIDR